MEFSQLPDDINQPFTKEGAARILSFLELTEIDAATIYRKAAEYFKGHNDQIYTQLYDIAYEEDVHLGELIACQVRLDPNYKNNINKGIDEATDEDEELPKFVNEYVDIDE